MGNRAQCETALRQLSTKIQFNAGQITCGGKPVPTGNGWLTGYTDLQKLIGGLNRVLASSEFYGFDDNNIGLKDCSANVNAAAADLNAWFNGVASTTKSPTNEAVTSVPPATPAAPSNTLRTSGTLKCTVADSCCTEVTAGALAVPCRCPQLQVRWHPSACYQCTAKYKYTHTHTNRSCVCAPRCCSQAT